MPQSSLDGGASRLWRRALGRLTDIQFTRGFFPLPKQGCTVVGGNLKLRADRVGIVLMTDRLTTSQEWAVVNVTEVDVQAEHEAEYVWGEGESVAVHLKQLCALQLGGASEDDTPHPRALFIRATLRTGRTLGGDADSPDKCLQVTLDAVVAQILHGVPHAHDVQLMELVRFPAMNARLITHQTPGGLTWK